MKILSSLKPVHTKVNNFNDNNEVLIMVLILWETGSPHRNCNDNDTKERKH